jgi:phage tail sheath protein FI
MQVIVPDFAGDTTVTGDLLDYAQDRVNSPSGGDRFIILTVPKGSSATDAVDWFRTKLGRFSDYAALYWPWVNISDPLANGRKLTMPVLGHIAGIYARTDVNRNVGKAPGGTVDGALSFLTGLEIVPTQGERDVVYTNKINPLISSPQTGLAVWGVRTISIQSQWRYINARRLFMFLEKSIFNSTFWIVFENNGPGLWARIQAQITGFLLGLFNDGYFAGVTPDQAFFVTVDDTNNTPATIDAGQVIIDIGVAPNKPAEFVRFRFAQITASG